MKVQAVAVAAANGGLSKRCRHKSPDQRAAGHGKMENPVGIYLEPQVSRTVRDAGEQVMPLQDLVQEDPVEKAADRHAEGKAAYQPPSL